jgi:hypothetical protein
VNLLIQEALRWGGREAGRQGGREKNMNYPKTFKREVELE